MLKIQVKRVLIEQAVMLRHPESKYGKNYG